MSVRLIVSVLVLAGMLVTTDFVAAQGDPVPDLGARELERTDSVLTDEAVSLGTTVITPTRSPMRLFDAPYAADVVTDEIFDRRFYRTTPQALRDVPGVMVQETGPGQGSPFIRGFTSQRTVLMIDGIRLNNSVFRDGPNQYWGTVDPFSISRYEVVRGPASVLYGSDAIGGAVNAVTIDPYAYGEQDHFAGRAHYRVSSGENSHIGRGEISGAALDDRFGFVIGGTGKHFGDMTGGEEVGFQPGTEYDEYDADAKIEYFLSDTTRIVAAHQRVRINNAPRTHRTNDAVLWEGTGPPGVKPGSGSPRIKEDFDQERELTYIQLHAENTGEFIENMHLSVSHHRQDEVRDRVRAGGRDLQGFEVNTLGVWASFESPTELGNWTYGLEYYRDWVDSFSSGNTIQGPVGDDATYDLLGIYVQNEYEWTDRWTTILGGRFTYARAEADSVDDGSGNRISVEDDYTALVGSGRVSYEAIIDHLNIYGGVSQGFRAPNLMDLTADIDAGSNLSQMGSAGLDSEHFTSFEIGAKARDDDWQLEVAYFYTLIDDLIVRAQRSSGSTIVDSVNAGEGYINGIEAGAAWRFCPQWTLFGNVSWQEGKIDRPLFATGGMVQEEYVSRLMPLTGLVGVRFEGANLPIWVEGLIRMADEQDKLAPNDITDNRIPPGGTPGYVVPSIYAGWRINEQASLNFGVENITDEDYRIHGSGQNMPGRNFLFSVDFRF